MTKRIVKKLLIVTATVGIITSMAWSSLAATTVSFNFHKSGSGAGDVTTSTNNIDGTSFNYTAKCISSTNGAGIRFTIEDGSYSTLLFGGQSYSLSRTKKNASGSCWVKGTLYCPNSSGSAQGSVTKN